MNGIYRVHVGIFGRTRNGNGILGVGIWRDDIVSNKSRGFWYTYSSCYLKRKITLTV